MPRVKGLEVIEKALAGQEPRTELLQHTLVALIHIRPVGEALGLARGLHHISAKSLLNGCFFDWIERPHAKERLIDEKLGVAILPDVAGFSLPANPTREAR